MNNQKILILGSSGRLGDAMHQHFSTHRPVQCLTRQDIDLNDPNSIVSKLTNTDFDILINCAAYTDVDGCETERDIALRINAHTVSELASLCTQKQAKMVHISTDYVFDGTKEEPYLETDSVNPISYYGETKLIGEQNVFAASPAHIVLRTSWVFGLKRPSFPEWILSQAQKSDQPIKVVGDKWSSPTRAEDIPILLEQLLKQHHQAKGIFHLSNEGECSWADYARAVLASAEEHNIPLKTKEIVEIPLSSLSHFKAKRPVYSSLSNKRYISLTGKIPKAWQEAIDTHIELISSNYLSTIQA